MNNAPVQAGAPQEIKRSTLRWGLGIFLLVAAAGLFYVKWNPYFHKALLAAGQHSIGKSIIWGETGMAPAPSWEAAFGYAKAYFRSVWQAVLLGLLLGSLMEVLLPRDWLRRMLGSSRWGGILLGGAAAMPGMMCTCCAAPVAAGLRRQSVPVGAALAFFLGNPTLNPATLVFMGFVLSWRWVALRAVVGLIMVFGLSWLAGRMAGEHQVSGRQPEMPGGGDEAPWLVRWMKSLARLAWESLPVYVVMVLLLGTLRAWLFPTAGLQWADSVWAIAFFALAGTLFMIPTAAEIPIVQALLSAGMGPGQAGALLLTLPVISLPSLLMVRGHFPGRVLVLTGVGVASLGILGGLLARAFFGI